MKNYPFTNTESTAAQPSSTSSTTIDPGTTGSPSTVVMTSAENGNSEGKHRVYISG